MSDEQRDPLERLRAADPAAGIEPRDGFADEVISRTTDATIGSSGTAAPDAPVADLDAARARRRRWSLVAAAAASALVVGAAGYGLGAAVGDPVNLAGGAEPPVSLQGAGAGTTEQAGAPGAAGGDLSLTEPDARGLSYPYGFGRNEFSSSGLSTTAGTAAAYAFDARTGSTEPRIAALADALGVEGTPTLADGGWSVGPRDGTAPSIWVSLDGTLSFSYFDPTRDPWRCETGEEPCEPSGDLPSEQAAIDALRSLVSSTGRDPSGYEFGAETWEGAVTRSAQAWPVVDGQRVDQAWTLELSTDGIVSAYGPLADLVDLGDVPIVSEQAAFERLSDPRFGAQVIALPFAAEAGVTADVDEWVPPTEAPAAPAPGTPLAWPVHRVEIVEARLGLGSQWQPDGSVVVVPGYEFTDADGATWSMIAIADEALDFSAE
ncbi:hypothetical protein [Agromyces sp. SYSU T0242]|uniref:hypothetical protein n=1 Tax=Agromyces litoreus TaxID=3158561 RepID=UPI003393354C